MDFILIRCGLLVLKFIVLPDDLLKDGFHGSRVSALVFKFYQKWGDFKVGSIRHRGEN